MFFTIGAFMGCVDIVMATETSGVALAFIVCHRCSYSTFFLILFIHKGLDLIISHNSVVRYYV